MRLIAACPLNASADLIVLHSFVDRDMFMRYQAGMAVGHLPQHIAKLPPKHPSFTSEMRGSPTKEPLPDHNSCAPETVSWVENDGGLDMEEIDKEETDGEDGEDGGAKKSGEFG